MKMVVWITLPCCFERNLWCFEWAYASSFTLQVNYISVILEVQNNSQTYEVNAINMNAMDIPDHFGSSWKKEYIFLAAKLQ